MDPLCLLVFTLEPCASSSRSWHHGFIHQRVRISRSFASILVRPSACIRCVGIQCTCFGDIACCTERIDTIDRFSEVLGFSAARQSYRLLAISCLFHRHFHSGLLCRNAEKQLRQVVVDEACPVSSFVCCMSLCCRVLRATRCMRPLFQSTKKPKHVVSETCAGHSTIATPYCEVKVCSIAPAGIPIGQDRCGAIQRHCRHSNATITCRFGVVYGLVDLLQVADLGVGTSVSQRKPQLLNLALFGHSTTEDFRQLI